MGVKGWRVICHGQGDPTNDGCCWVEGAPCPLRLKITGGRVFDASGNDLGTVDTYINSLVQSGAARTRAKAQVQGVRIACRAAVEVLANDAKLLNDRAGFEAAWNQHPAYVALVRPTWARVEDSLGLARGSYQCSTWKGTGSPQCCFAEDPVSNAAKAAGLTSTAVTIRTAGGL